MASSHTSSLESHYPWTSKPLLAGAPMRLISTSPLAVSVSLAGGLGFLGIGTDSSTLSSLLQATTKSILANPIPNTPSGILPVGIGFICWGADLSTALDVLRNETLKPAAAWLFAPKSLEDLVAWTDGIREVTEGKTRIWVQVGTVKNAIEVARRCRPDLLVIQGSDAGGHGLKQSASIVSLLPECVDALKRESMGTIPLIAAGGIADARGFVAALVLGASGAAIGTRFLASPEAAISQGYKEDVLRSRDGGITTARTNLYDTLRGTKDWPASYNARGVLNESFFDGEKGLSEDENRKLYEEALKRGDDGWGERGRMTAYAGTNVGLVTRVIPAGDIVRELLSESRKALAIGSAKL